VEDSSPWTLLILGSAASLAANVAVADPTLWSRVIHAWPSFALMGAYELLMREFRTHAHSEREMLADGGQMQPSEPPVNPADGVVSGLASRGDDGGSEGDGFESGPRLRVVEASTDGTEMVAADAPEPTSQTVPPRVQVEAWRWALDNRSEDGALPSGKEIAARFDHKERWGRLIKQWGQQGRFREVAS
jgi:hypothetical protein